MCSFFYDCCDQKLGEPLLLLSLGYRTVFSRMSDGPRHSADIPLSKALVALRRVRSLRDPSTNSMSKFTAFVDNLSWEANSCHGMLNSCHEGGLKNHSFHDSQNFSLDGRKVEFDGDPELGFSSRRSSCKSVLSKNTHNIGIRSSDIREYSKSKCDVIHGNKSSSEIHFGNHRDKALQLACVPTSSDHMEHVDSYGEPALGSGRLERVDPTVKRKSGYGARTKSSLVEANVVGSNVSSPNPSVSDVRLEGSSHSTSLFANEEVDRYHHGCGISRCWSRTPRLRESNLPSDFEDYPLLSRECGEMDRSGQGQSCTYSKRKITHYSGSPSNFCQKFRPRSFNDLVGQHVVARSLLNAILKGRITSFYLFHGPRGTGKTSTSKIFAAALNCLSLEEHRPCWIMIEILLSFVIAEANLQKLRHALKVLSETEKQLRSSKNQTTWLTVALLQLSSVESSSLDANDSRVCLRTVSERDEGFGRISSTREILKHPVSYLCDENKSHNSEMHGDCKEKLENIWSRVMESCHSNTLKSFLQKEGRLASVCINQGLAIAEVEFYHRDHVFRAEKSWKLIAGLLQHVLGCNVEIRINLVPCTATKTAKVKKQSFCLLSCSRGMEDNSSSISEDGDDQFNDSNFISGRVRKREKSIDICSDSQSQNSIICSHSKEAANTSRNNEVISQSTGIFSLHRSEQHDTQKVSHLGVGLNEEEGNNHESQVFAIEEPENQPSYFSKTLRLHQTLCSSSSLHTICLEIQQDNKLELAIPRKTYFCLTDPYILCSSSNTHCYSSGDEDGQRKESRVSSRIHCWRAPKFPFKKAWKLRQQQQQQSSKLMGCILSCVSAR
ncbi:protein STICHEL-like 2 [Telopea speciosissima]|uniref:protein STICHEL-like 2 n=1 Tax=Telopea speciosissima TaxID=54955 RepID=UPI001CC54800|nr:protein STICHEL-like 2 [Telopea speciosissima]